MAEAVTKEPAGLVLQQLLPTQPEETAAKTAIDIGTADAA